MALPGPTLLTAAFNLLLLVAAVYVGTTLALRGFFGREYYDPRTGEWAGEGTEGGSEGAD
jgi:hypothetical protein